MAEFRNVWDENNPTQQCVACGEVVHGLAGVMMHQCPWEENSKQQITDKESNEGARSDDGRNPHLR